MSSQLLGTFHRLYCIKQILNSFVKNSVHNVFLRSFNKVFIRIMLPIWRGTHLPGLGNHSFTHSLFALLLKIAHFKERPWVIRSCHSLKKSDYKYVQIALISLYQTDSVSKSLSSLFKKEQCEWFTRYSSKLRTKNEQFAQRKSYFLYVFHCFSPFYA